MAEMAERKRKVKFGDDEIDILVTEMQLAHPKLQKKTTTPREKALIWNNILHKVNAVGLTRRTVPDLKKRWQDIRRRTKEKLTRAARHSRGTGGGPPENDELTPTEQAVEETFHEEQIAGVDGGIDIAELDEEIQGGFKCLITK